MNQRTSTPPTPNHRSRLTRLAIGGGLAAAMTIGLDVAMQAGIRNLPDRDGDAPGIRQRDDVIPVHAGVPTWSGEGNLQAPLDSAASSAASRKLAKEREARPIALPVLSVKARSPSICSTSAGA